jgi:hypothetical protein
MSCTDGGREKPMTEADAQVRAFLEEVGRKRGMPSFFDRFVFHQRG